MNYEPDADNLTTSPQWRRTVESTGHSFAIVASWTVRGSNVPGEMQGCVRCGLVLINDRRGVLLIAPGGFNRMHKRIFPCQGPPVCQGPPFGQGAAWDSDGPLIELRRRLEEKHDPRFSLMWENHLNRQFAFEAEINCLPMSVKRKLDRVALKIGRKQWLELRPEERMAISRLPSESKEECEALRIFIRGVLARHSMEPISLPEAVGQFADPPVEVPVAVIESAREVGFLLDQQKWSKLDDDQRYALTKLIDPAKKSKRARALAEFFSGALAPVGHKA